MRAPQGAALGPRCGCHRGCPPCGEESARGELGEMGMETPVGVTLQMLQRGGESPAAGSWPYRGCRVGMWGWGLQPQMGDNVPPSFPCAVRLHSSTPHNPDPLLPHILQPPQPAGPAEQPAAPPRAPQKMGTPKHLGTQIQGQAPRGPGLGTQTRSMGPRCEAKPPPHPVPGGFPVYFLPY